MLIIDGWPVDVLLSGELVKTATATEHPVEAGADVTDHIRPGSDELTIESIVSDTPIGDIATDPSRAALIDPLNPEDSRAALPSSEAYEMLSRIHAESRLVVVEVPIPGHEPGTRRVLTSLALIRLSEPLGPERDGGMRFSATFKRITVVTNRRIGIGIAPNVGASSVPRGNGQRADRATSTIPVAQLKFLSSSLWQMGIPAGNNIEPHSPFAVVEARTSKEELSKLTGERRRTGAGPVYAYVWGAKSSTGVAGRSSIPASYGYAPGAELSDFALSQYRIDQQRSIRSADEQRAIEALKKTYPKGTKVAPGQYGELEPGGVDVKRLDPKGDGLFTGAGREHDDRARRVFGPGD